MAGIVETIHKAARRPVCVSASADRHQPFVDTNRHALIEDKALAPPVLVSELFLVTHNAAMQLEDVGEAFVAEKGGRLLATNPAGAIHQDLALFQCRKAFDVGRELAEVLDIARNRSSKLSRG